ncbi:MAG TPA: SAM-dependent methyltransferase [Cyanobium sp.]|nr:SAM-dependent methyltransferase [Cyanobium sp.]
MTTLLPPTDSRSALSDQVRRQFGRGAAGYEAQALLQRAVACRLGRLCRDLPLPAGPRADLGAGSGLLSRALLRHCHALAGEPPQQIDNCPELLARNPLVGSRVWDLNSGLPGDLHGAALLASSFALQWLDAPAAQLAHWCDRLRPEGWLAVALPTSGSFPQWHRAAAAAGVPCTALEFPDARALRTVTRGRGLVLQHARVLRFSHPERGGLETLRHLRSLGAATSRQPPLGAGQLRRLLAHWPTETPLSWEVLLLVGRKL